MSDPLFESGLLEGLIPEDALDSDLVLRPLDSQDYSKGYLELLSQLTTVGSQEESAFKQQFTRMKEAKTYFVLVIEDLTTNRIIAATTLFLEHKFIHSNGFRGRIEEVVVDDKYRGRRLGKTIVSVAAQLAKKLKCYKLSLDCRDSLIDFYQSLGFVSETGRGNMLVQRFLD